jgi:hypothetical protein
VTSQFSNSDFAVLYTYDDQTCKQCGLFLVRGCLFHLLSPGKRHPTKPERAWASFVFSCALCILRCSLCVVSFNMSQGVGKLFVMLPVFFAVKQVDWTLDENVLRARVAFAAVHGALLLLALYILYKAKNSRIANQVVAACPYVSSSSVLGFPPVGTMCACAAPLVWWCQLCFPTIRACWGSLMLRTFVLSGVVRKRRKKPPSGNTMWPNSESGRRLYVLVFVVVCQPRSLSLLPLWTRTNPVMPFQCVWRKFEFVCVGVCLFVGWFVCLCGCRCVFCYFTAHPLLRVVSLLFSSPL